MKVHQYSMLCAPITSQIAGIEALEAGAPSVEEMRKELFESDNVVMDKNNDHGLSRLSGADVNDMNTVD